MLSSSNLETMLLFTSQCFCLSPAPLSPRRFPSLSSMYLSWPFYWGENEVWVYRASCVFITISYFFVHVPHWYRMNKGTGQKDQNNGKHMYVLIIIYDMYISITCSCQIQLLFLISQIAPTAEQYAHMFCYTFRTPQGALWSVTHLMNVHTGTYTRYTRSAQCPLPTEHGGHARQMFFLFFFSLTFKVN